MKISNEMKEKINDIVQQAMSAAQETLDMYDDPIKAKDLHPGDGEITTWTDEIVWLLEGKNKKRNS